MSINGFLNSLRGFLNALGCQNVFELLCVERAYTNGTISLDLSAPPPTPSLFELY
jgi:hypothetical protein